MTDRRATHITGTLCFESLPGYTTCPGCGFDSLRTLKLTMLFESGVSPLTTGTVCDRCYDLARP